MEKKKRIQEIALHLQELDREKRRLIEELEKLRPDESSRLPPFIGTPAAEAPPGSAKEKIDLFMRLFRCREDVYPRLWENASKTKQGYSPVCKSEWVPGICRKPEIKCARCPNRSFAGLDAKSVRAHLEGKIAIGTYAIREDDTCVFLAADFDKINWREDVLAYQKAARLVGIGVSIERSRSGNGAHAWIFFSQPLPAGLARQLGTVIMARASSRRYNLSLDSYDRFFPNQDSLPKGGFGNLIALPLQGVARRKGNSVFVDDGMAPYQDQWEFLARQPGLSFDEVGNILDQAIPKEDSSFSLLSRNADIKVAEKAIDYSLRELNSESFPGLIQMELEAQLSIAINGLPSKLISAFKRTATFANPKFFELQRLRFSTWRTPRYIFCGELLSNRLVLPRGTLADCLELAKVAGAQVNLADKRVRLKKVKMRFQGDLSREQEKAVTQLAKFEDGVLVAPPGVGKTVIACALIGKRKARTLILVHRKQLLDQWERQLSRFLTVNPERIGVLGGSRKKLSGVIDIGMLQTLAKLKCPQDALSNYEQVIVDECHHISAFSFESVVKEIPARYFLGLTATPYRKDGHQAIIYMQCGPLRYEISAVHGPELSKRVVVRETSFSMPPEAGPQPPIHEVWDRLISDPERLDLIAQDVKDALESGRFPLILSERKEHLRLLAEAIRKQTVGLSVKEFRFAGEMGKRARKKALEGIQNTLKNATKPYILSTGSLIGEGFDLPELDTLILAMPISFKGRIIQYAGRLHRQSPGKSNALIYDYLDSSSGLTISMFKKRVAAYKKMGYRIESPGDGKANRWLGQRELF